MSQTSKRQAADDTPKRGDAAWRAQKEAIAGRNERAQEAARARRAQADGERLARQRAADQTERAELAKRNALRP